MNYDEFIQAKIRDVTPSGFTPSLPIHAKLFPWQVLVVEWALKMGRCALFEDCGLGKTIQQLEWARQVSFKTSAPVLIICPLAVANQTVEEAKKFGFPPVVNARQPEDIKGEGVYVTNYDRLELFEDIINQLGGVVLDESSILKSFDGKTRRMLNELFMDTPYKLACTATPAPNDFTELGQHAEFLNVCKPAEMLATYFINDTFDTGEWRLKGHAETEFWRWVSSWAACISKPSDLGFSDEGYELPPLNLIPVWVDVDVKAEAGSEELFRNPELSATTINNEMRKTITERCNAALELFNAEPNESWAVWCNLNDEQDIIEDLLGDSCVSVRGSDKSDNKIKREEIWRGGEVPAIVTKGSIFGQGMNWQHCHNLIIFPTYSYEDYYQILRRFYRFGQKHPVNCHVVLPKTANKILQTLQRKSANHETMKDFMKFTAENLTGNSKFVTFKTEIVKHETPNWTVYNGDCVRVAKTFADNSIGFSVFSPPFADLFTYSNDIQDMGNCSGLDEFMIQFGFLIDELARVMMPGREVAVHCCDLLATKWKDGAIEFKDFSGAISEAFRSRGFLFHSRITIWKSPVVEMQRTKAHGLLYKTLKTDSSKSRVGAADYLLVFRKRGDNPRPIVQTPESISLDRWQELASPVWMTVDQGRVLNGEFAREDKDERHVCPLQLDVIERALTLWSAKDDLVFSPFTGIGSEGYCSIKMGRKFVGSELKESYWKTAINYLERAEQETASDLFKFAVVA